MLEKEQVPFKIYQEPTEKKEKLKQLIKGYQAQTKNKVPKRGEILLIKLVMMTTDDLKNIQLFEIFIKNTPETGLVEPSKIVLNHPFSVFKELRLEKSDQPKAIKELAEGIRRGQTEQ
ncbi:20309_t:CDS:2, partial [Funneliformis geosporum]